MSRVLFASTIPTFAMGAPYWHHWLQNAEQITEHARNAGHDVDFYAVLQADARGLAPFHPLINRLDEITDDGAQAFSLFSLDLGEDEWTTGSRLAGIVTGRNLIIDRALRRQHEWIYFADSDIEAPDDVLPRLLEVDWPVVGAHVPTYCLNGPRVDHEYADIQEHWNTAGSLLVRRDVFRRIPWRFDPDAGHTDDPATQHEMARVGFPTRVRHDVICTHHPQMIGGFESRNLDRKVYR